MKELNNFLLCSVFSAACILFRKVLYVTFRCCFVKNGAGSRILKMQNKAKFKTAKIAVTPLMPRTNKNALRPPQPKNKPKQTQIKDTATRLSGLSAAPASLSRRSFSQDGSPRKSAAARAARLFSRRNMPSPPYKKMTNEPNFRTCKMSVSHFLSKTNDYSPATNDHKNEPKQSQFFLPR
jgi:hypothetical protein